MNITFRDIDGTTMIETVLNSLAGVTVEIKYTKLPTGLRYEGFPKNAVIVAARPDGVLITDHDASGKPTNNVKWLAPYHIIKTVTVI